MCRTEINTSHDHHVTLLPVVDCSVCVCRTEINTSHDHHVTLLPVVDCSLCVYRTEINTSHDYHVTIPDYLTVLFGKVERRNISY